MCARGSASTRLRYSLSANALHGLPRCGADYAKAYSTACKNGQVDAVNVEAVRDLLHCSTRTACDLAAAAREGCDRARNQQIAALKAEGKSVREIARETDLPKSTVHDVVRNFAGCKIRTA